MVQSKKQIVHSDRIGMFFIMEPTPPPTPPSRPLVIIPSHGPCWLAGLDLIGLDWGFSPSRLSFPAFGNEMIVRIVIVRSEEETTAHDDMN